MIVAAAAAARGFNVSVCRRVLSHAVCIYIAYASLVNVDLIISNISSYMHVPDQQ